MKLWFLFFVYGIVMIACENVFNPPGDFLVLAVIYLGMCVDEVFKGWVASLILGFLVDAASLSHFGTTLFSYSLVFAFASFLRRHFLFKTFYSKGVAILFFNLIYVFATFIVLSLFFSEPRPIFMLYSRSLFLDIGFNALFGIFWFAILDRYSSLTLDKLTMKKDPLL